MNWLDDYLADAAEGICLVVYAFAVPLAIVSFPFWLLARVVRAVRGRA